MGNYNGDAQTNTLFITTCYVERSNDNGVMN